MASAPSLAQIKGATQPPKMPHGLGANDFQGPKPAFGNAPGIDAISQATGGQGLSLPKPGSFNDWADAFWGSLGLPPNLVSQINGIFAQTPDQSQAYVLAKQALQGSDWYQSTFPGIGAGIQAGMFTDETGYRAYVNDLNNLYQQYYNRAVTSDEVQSWLNQGKDPRYVAEVFQGTAIANTMGPQWQYLAGAQSPQGRLTGEQKIAAGEEQAGLDTPLGQQIQERLKLAEARLQKITAGTVATPSLGLGEQGLYSPSLQGAKQGRGGNPDVGAV